VQQSTKAAIDKTVNPHFYLNLSSLQNTIKKGPQPQPKTQSRASNAFRDQHLVVKPPGGAKSPKSITSLSSVQ
jgi:hypothetical protein